MSNKILFIFEGEKSEIQIVKSLQKFFINENTIVKCVYGAEIYQLYKNVSADSDLDTFNLLKERNDQNRISLKDYSRKDFAEIYLFFDYDGHSTLADDNKLMELVNFFTDETDKGKLYVSYPMVESLWHIPDIDSFHNLMVECKKNVIYKNIVHTSCLPAFSDIKKYDLSIWTLIIKAHLNKLNFIIEGSFSMPNEVFEQSIIFENQLKKYITPYKTVAVLSAFPVFIHDYYGNEITTKMILT